MREKTCWRWALALAVFLVFESPAAARLAEIVSITGKGEYRQLTDADWREAKLKQQLVGGDLVRTLDLSAMALLFADKTQIRLAQNSMFQVRGTDPKGTSTINLRQGRAWSQAKDKAGKLIMETPSAVAAIRGTDWEMEVDLDGRARLTVLHGEVEFYNEQGRVTVRDNEHAVAEKGKAPVKLLLQNPRERVQWVTAYTVDISRYAELSEAALAASGETNRVLREVVALIREQRMKEAHDRLVELARAPQLATAVVSLLLADFAIYAGELKRAEEILEQGRQRFAKDPRFHAQLARVALFRDDLAASRGYLEAGLAQFPDSVDLKLVEGEIARFDGLAAQATAAYRAATVLAPKDARGWHGRGVVESEKEEVKRARPLLGKALELNPAHPGTRGELATLETFANNFDAARRHYERALEAQPDDYVALTGLGLLQLKAGETEQALDTLLRANVIEPRYARAVVYSAIAYYQLGRHGTALETLARASELDPRDPLPHQLASMIHTDLVEPGQALDAARRAMRLMPFLKSLNQLANDQKGAANLGNALAQFGLDDWAFNYAHQSYSPFWAGSHLFLADRYPDGFNKQSELMQGFITDPTLFGASNRFQTLLPKPGHYFSAGATVTRSDDLRTTMPSFVANGFSNSAFPVAYFVEGLHVKLHPGNVAFDGKGSIVTAALGLAPRHDLSLFAFVSAFDADINSPAPSFKTDRTSGWENRLDLGLNYKFSPTSQSWLKFGIGEESAVNTTTEQQATRNVDTRFDFRPRNEDVQYRHSMRMGNHELTGGIENARARKSAVLTSNSRINFGSTVLATQIRDDSPEKDKSWMAYLSDRVRFNEQWVLELGMHYQDYEKNATSVTQVSQGAFVFSDGQSARHARSGFYPRLGLAYQRRADEVWRLGYQKWLRPNAANTMSPVATAGIPLDDQVVLPGGELERARFQFEKELSASTFVSLFLDRKRIHHLGEAGAVLNQREEVANLDRLRNRSALILRGSGEILEQPSVFLEGRINSGGVSINQRLSNTLSGYANYVHTDSRNTHRFFKDFDLPFMPRHRVTLGVNWVGMERLLLQAQTIYRSNRFVDEFHSDELPAGWDATLKATWQSADKRWLIEGFATNLLKDRAATVVGVNAVWRY